MLLTRAKQAFERWVFPPQCLGCRALLSAGTGLCPPCWSSLQFFPQDQAWLLDAEAESSNNALDKSRFALLYNKGILKKLILRFKYGDDMRLATLFAQWIVRSLPLDNDFWKSSGEVLLVPIPLHWRRLAKRQYNQAALLAQSLGFLTGLPVVLNLLKRTRSGSQEGKSVRQRFETTKNAFTVNLPKAFVKAPQKIILIDDVMTSGATLHAAALTLKKEGFGPIYGLCLAGIADNFNFETGEGERSL